MEKAMFVTTIDNPFDYFTQFDDWYRFDTDKGYNTCGLVARLAKVSQGLSEQDEIDAINRACETIVRLDPFEIYRITTENGSETES